MKKILSNMFFIALFLMSIKTTSSEKLEQIQPILDKNFVMLGCYGIQANNSKIYVTNLEDEIKKTLQTDDSLDNDSAGIVIDYLHYNSIHWNPKEQILIGNISEKSSDTFVSFFPNLDESIVNKLKLICNTSDSLDINKKKLSTIIRALFVPIYCKKMRLNNYSFTILFKKTEKRYLYSILNHFGHFVNGWKYISQEKCITEYSEEIAMLNKENITDDFKNEKTICLATPFDDYHLAKRVHFIPNQDSPINILTIGSILSSNLKKEKDPQ